MVAKEKPKMEKWGGFCSYCGKPLGDAEFPRACEHGHVTYVGWHGVGVALQPVIEGNETYLLVVQRGIKPFIGGYALPGGFAENDETLRQAAARELYEETGLRQDDNSIKETFHQAVGSPHQSGNDPRNTMLQFEVMPSVKSVDIDLSFTTQETQKLLLIRYSQNKNDLIDSAGNTVELCFPLHQETAKNFLKTLVR
jgi:ADP-ribose pyrophosphatase YjhB (NUDIX family)